MNGIYLQWKGMTAEEEQHATHIPYNVIATNLNTGMRECKAEELVRFCNEIIARMKEGKDVYIAAD